MALKVKPGQTIPVGDEKWLVLRVAGGRAENKRMGLEEVAEPLPNRRARRKLWAEIKRKARKGR